MPLRLYCSRDPRRLLSVSAEGYLARRAASPETPFPNVEYLLALRQGGLRDDLFARAAELGIGGWWNPPLCTFAELPALLGLPARPAITDFARLVLLGEVVRSAAPELLGSTARHANYLDAIDRLIGDLIQEGAAADAFATSLERRPDRDAFEIRRDNELASIYRAWLTALEREGLRDPRAARIDCARTIQANPASLDEALGGRREIRFLGLHDLKGGWHELIFALRDSGALDRIAIYSADPAIGDDLGVEAEWLDDCTSVADRVFGGARDAAAQVTAISAPDPERGLEEIAVRIRRLIDAGTPLTRIAVVCRNARPLVDTAVDTMERAGIPAAARRRIGFAEIPAVRAVSALFAAAADGWTRHGLTEVASQPYLATDVDARLVNALGYESRIEGLDAWVAAFASLLKRARFNNNERELDERRKPLPPAPRVERALEGVRAFADLARPLDTPRPLADWLAWLGDALAKDRFGIEHASQRMIAGRWDIVRRDLVGLKALREAVEESRSAVKRWGADKSPLTAAQFHERLQELLSADAALWTPTHRGVCVLEALAAVYRSFDHVFVVGMEAGSFPARPRRTVLMDETEVEALAESLPLETDATWQAREQTLFRLLLGSAPSVTLVYSRLDDRGRDVARSAFVDALSEVATLNVEEIPTGRVITPVFPLWTSDVAADQARHGAYVERERALAAPGPFNGLISDPALLARIGERIGEQYVWSPTQLESFAKCPWAWFSQRLLRLDLLEDPDLDLDSATRGTILHRALQKLFDHLVAAAGKPVFLDEDDLPALLPLADKMLNAAVAELEGTVWLGHRALRESKMAEMRGILHDYLTWEVDENRKSFKASTNAGKNVRTAVAEHELAFDGLVFERNGVRVRFRGSIDRVEVQQDDMVPGSQWAAAVDYKSSQWSVPGSGKEIAWEEGVVLQVPLYAWALEQLRPGLKAARTEYRSLRNPKALLVLRLATVARKTGVVTMDPEARARLDSALDAVARHVTDARTGKMPARYVSSCGCPSWCHGWDVCRVPGGPMNTFDF